MATKITARQREPFNNKQEKEFNGQSLTDKNYNRQRNVEHKRKYIFNFTTKESNVHSKTHSLKMSLKCYSRGWFTRESYVYLVYFQSLF